MRLGVFGGSFDPIHNAHLVAARVALEQLGLDEVRFVVAGSQPHKPEGHHASATHRVEMVRAAVASIPDMSVDDREVIRGGPSFTVETLRDIQSEVPAAELYLLLGADAALRFAEWREPEVVRQLARVAILSRPGIDVPAGFDRTVAIPAIDISSTAIRARAAEARSLAGWVPDAVADYISGLRLYLRLE